MSYLKQFILLVWLSAAFGVTAQETKVEVRAGSRPDAPPYGVRGPHAVGTRDFVIQGDEPLDITLWYPALNAEDAEEVISYPYEIKMDAPAGAVATVAGHALRDASFNLSASPYPLVILSPGFSLGRTNYAWLAEHLASHGFVVIAPEHHEYLDTEQSELWQAAITRPQEIHKVLDYVDEQVKAGGVLEQLTNTDTVAVIGHSYGGNTSLVMAGARFDMKGLESLCKTAKQTNDPNVWLCDLIVPHIADMAKLAGLESVPEGLWPSWGDSRIDAIVPMAGDAYFFAEAGLAEITVPVMAIGGTRDTVTPYMWGTYPTYEHISSSTKARVSFENNETIALSYLATRILESTLLIVGIISFLFLIPISQEYIAGTADTSYLQTLGMLAVKGNFFAYQLGMMVLGIGSLLFCYTLYESKLIPRFLSAWGFVGYAALLMGAVLELFGFKVGLFYSIPGGLFEIALPLWLLAKGFN